MGFDCEFQYNIIKAFLIIESQCCGVDGVGQCGSCIAYSAGVRSWFTGIDQSFI